MAVPVAMPAGPIGQPRKLTIGLPALLAAFPTTLAALTGRDGGGVALLEACGEHEREDRMQHGEADAHYAEDEFGGGPE